MFLGKNSTHLLIWSKNSIWLTHTVPSPLILLGFPETEVPDLVRKGTVIKEPSHRKKGITFYPLLQIPQSLICQSMGQGEPHDIQTLNVK
jgi:hypothetical protein